MKKTIFSRHLIFASSLVLLLLLSGCSGLTQEQAEQAADDFISKNVVFYAKEQGNQTTSFEDYEVAKTSYKEGSDWIIIANIRSDLDGQTKQNTISLKIGRKGDVVEFNGMALDGSGGNN